LPHARIIIYINLLQHKLTMLLDINIVILSTVFIRIMTFVEIVSSVDKNILLIIFE